MDDSVVSHVELANPSMRSEQQSQHLNLPSSISPATFSVDTHFPWMPRDPCLTPIDSFPSSSSSSSSSSSRTIYTDRFIPSRVSSNFALFNVSPLPNGEKEDGSCAYTSLLRTAMFGGGDSTGFSPLTPEKVNYGNPNRNIFRFKTEVRRSLSFPSRFDNSFQDVVPSLPKVPRKVPRSPFKVLDAPALQDDFYLNLVDWSSDNVLAVSLANCVYLWSASSGKVTKLCDLGLDDSVCSVGWAQRDRHLAVGTKLGKVQIWDASHCRKIRTMEGHRLRVGALAWSSFLLSSGSRDKSICHRDIRAQEDSVSKLTGHKSEVCGLKWSYDNRELASGGNDNRLLVWNQHSTHPVLKFCEHTAAVKAIAWSPHTYGLLASGGGGTADRCIRFWNTSLNSHLNTVDTGSQVCNLIWSKNVNELVSTHGYSQNQIIVWQYSKMSKLATLTGHTLRVLYLAISPDGQTIVTGAGDETLRFWNVFPSPKFQGTNSDIGRASLGRSQIRTIHTTLERYRKHSKENGASGKSPEQSMQQWKNQAVDMAKKVEQLEISKRRMMGEGLEFCSMEELQEIEGQLDRSLKSIRERKVHLFMEQIEKLTEKQRMLSEENALLRAECETSGAGTGQVIHTDQCELPLESDQTDVETELHIGMPQGRRGISRN